MRVRPDLSCLLALLADASGPLRSQTPPTPPGPYGGEDAAGPIFTPELLQGGTVWRDMSAHPGARDYHSAAILLPNGRVFVCGGEKRKQGANPGPDYLIWEPPYFRLQHGSVPPQGVLVTNPAGGTVSQVAFGGMSYGQGIFTAFWANTLEPGISVDQVVLMRPAAMTHHDDGGQRMCRLRVQLDDDTPSRIRFRAPNNAAEAPPGWWMLFLVTSSGRPSQAYWVNLQ